MYRRFLSCCALALCLAGQPAALALPAEDAATTQTDTAQTDATQTDAAQTPALPVYPESALGIAEPALDEQIYGLEALLYCAETGQTLFEKGADVAAPPASTTKLMTALLVLEHCDDLSVTTTVSETALDIDPDSTSIALMPGEVVTLEDMLAATLITSANDAANVLAEYVGGSQEGFAKMMNERAAELGCTGSHFANAHGLDDPDHYVTARDLARITVALLKDDRFAEISSTQLYVMEPTNLQPEAREFYTKQNILRPDSDFYDESAIAAKNGWTSKAQYTQVAVARRDGMTLIAVSLGSRENKYYHWRDMRTLFSFGFGNYALSTLTADQVAALAVDAGAKGTTYTDCDPATVALPKTADPTALTLSDAPDADGYRSLMLDGAPVAQLSYPLPADIVQADAPATNTPTPPADLGDKLAVWGDNFILGLQIAGGVLALLVVLLIVRIAVRRRRVRRQRRRIAELRRTARARTSDELTDADLERFGGASADPDLSRFDRESDPASDDKED